MDFAQASLQNLMVVIAAAGDGTRLRTEDSVAPKQWLLLGGAPIVAHGFRFFDALEGVEQIVVALDAESLARPERTQWLRSAHGRRVRLVAGAATRQESVYRALQAIDAPVWTPENGGAKPVVLVHDAARPFPPRDAVRRAVAAAREDGGAILARRVVETLKRAAPDGIIVETLDRECVWAAQTPQVFQYAPLMAAYRAAEERLADFTDDAGVFQAYGGRVRVIEGPAGNLKITLPEDISHAERILAGQNRAENNS